MSRVETSCDIAWKWYYTPMKKSASEALREAIEAYGNLSRLSRESGVDIAILSRFTRGESAAGLGTLDKLLGPLGLELRSAPKKPASSKPRGRKA